MLKYFSLDCNNSFNQSDSPVINLKLIFFYRIGQAFGFKTEDFPLTA